MYQLTDKHNQLKQFKDDLFNKTLSMFEWENLPETIPQVELEKLIQINGFAVIAKYQGDLYAFNAGFSGQDAYQRPTQAIVNNPALEFNQAFTINQDCVVIRNDDMNQGLTRMFEKYGQLAIENMITMLMTDYNLRMPFTISSQDDSTTESAKSFLQKIVDGSLGVIGESKLFQSLNVTPTKNNNGSNFADLYGYQQYILAELNNAIGLATNNNMKRERLTTNEIEVNKNASYPLVDNMIRNRQTAVDKINAIFDTDINVEFSSIWGGTEPDGQGELDEPRDDEQPKPDDEQPKPDDEQPKPDDEQPKPDDDQPEDDKPASDNDDVVKDTTGKLSTDDQHNHDDDKKKKGGEK